MGPPQRPEGRVRQHDFPGGVMERSVFTPFPRGGEGWGEGARHLRIPAPYTLTLHPPSSLRRMLTAVELEDEPCGAAGEVGDMPTNQALTDELRTIELTG